MSIDNYQDYKCSTEVTIASGATESTAAYLGGTRCVAIVTPSSITGTSLTLKGSFDGVNYFDLYNSSGTKLTITASSSQWIALVPADLAGAAFLKVVSGSAEAAERTITLVTRPLS